MEMTSTIKRADINGCGVVMKLKKGGLLRFPLVWRCDVSQCTAECGMLRKE